VTARIEDPAQAHSADWSVLNNLDHKLDQRVLGMVDYAEQGDRAFSCLRCGLGGGRA
jgi:hypothetical protein